MNPGDKVRLKSDPSRIGVLGSETQIRGGKPRLHVNFFDGTEQFVLEQALELVSAENTNPYALFREGKYGHLEDLRGALTYFRLSGKLANLIYSLNTTNTEFFSYQFKPVLNFLESPSRGILIADEVGLGKTIEAGLIWTELRSRFDARRLLILCPAMLRDKWKMELSGRFGIDASICSARDLVEILHQFKQGDIDTFSVIGSLQGLRPPVGWDNEKAPAKGHAATLARLLDESEHDDPLFDLVIVDEAHYLRNRETLTARLGGLVRSVADGLVLLSATPIQTENTDLYSLVRLLDESNFQYEVFFQNALNSSKPLVAVRDDILAGRATRQTFIDGLTHASAYRALSSNQQIQYLLANPPSDEELANHSKRSALADTIDRINPLSKVISRTRKRDVHERKVTREPRAITVPMSPIEKTFYSQVTTAIRQFCERHQMPEGFIVTIPQRQMTSSMAAACRSWAKKRDELEDELDDDFLSEALNLDDEDAPVRPKLGPLMRRLMQIAEQVGDYPQLFSNDSKYDFLLANLREYWAKNPGKKIVLFAFYRGTLFYLHERLIADGIDAMYLMGGMNKQEALQQFSVPSGPKLLLASEVASEGIDLQFSSLLINYDLPWNPMKIEQRIGRIDRIGQKEPSILIWNIFHADTIDERVYERLLARLDIFRTALGSMEGVLGDRIIEMTNDLFVHTLTPEQERNVIEQTYMAIANRRRHEEQLEEESSHLLAHGDYIQNKVKAAQELKRFVTSDDLYYYVHDYFDTEYKGCRFVRLTDDQRLYEIDLVAAAKREFAEFLQRERLLGTTKLAAPVGVTAPQYVFENKVAIGHPQVETISQYHPVVRFVSEKYKAKGTRVFHPVVSVQIDANRVPQLSPRIYVFSIARWFMRVATRDIERLAYHVVALDDGTKVSDDVAENLISTAAMYGTDWRGAKSRASGALVEERFGECEDGLDTRYHAFVDDLRRDNADRIALQLHNLDSHLQRETAKLNDLIYRLRAANKLRGARLSEDKLKKLKQKIEGQIEFVSSAKTPIHSSTSVTSGVILVE